MVSQLSSVDDNPRKKAIFRSENSLFSMAMVTLTSGCTNTTHLRDASFSSYLNCSEEAFVRKLGETSTDQIPKIAPPSDSFHFGRKKEEEEDGEIGVFGAEKYFNEGRDDDDGPINPTLAVFKNGENDFARNQPRTPSVYSESSSWNSQSALLKNVPRKPPHHKRRSKSLLTSIRCINCSCNDDKSVDIGDKKNPKRSLNYGGFEGNNSAPTNKAELNQLIMKQIQSRKIDETGRGLRIEDGFSFPVLSPKPGYSKHQNAQPKKSLEVFGSPTTERKKNSFNLDRRASSVLPWNPNAGLEELEDTESDASSDLFEIEDFRGNGKDFFLARNASDGMSSYAASEASIEWSVVTASVADFEDLMPSSEAARGYKMSPNGRQHGGGKGTERRRSGILSGCKSQKAVMVAGDAYRTNGNPRTPYKSDSFGRSATRFQAESRKTSFDFTNRPYSFDAATAVDYGM